MPNPLPKPPPSTNDIDDSSPISSPSSSKITSPGLSKAHSRYKGYNGERHIVRYVLSANDQETTCLCTSHQTWGYAHADL
ncbi:carboxymuconolactone decarboxylase [Moniliophthora roreri]|nr:carboxymuconolactone decarboxylase [Moniliophthora roreri]